jgi:hypothetical protein
MTRSVCIVLASVLISCFITVDAQAQTRAVRYCLGQYNTEADCPRSFLPGSYSECTYCTSRARLGDYIYLRCGSDPEKVAAEQCGVERYVISNRFTTTGNYCGYTWFSVTCKVRIR